MPQPIAEILKLNQDAIIEMFVLDLNPIGINEVSYWCNFKQTNGNAIVFQGITYTPIPIKIEGIGLNGRGKLPTPTIETGNVLGLISSLVESYDDLILARVIRKRTFAKYLDNGSTPDPTIEFIPSVWRVQRKVEENKLKCVFALSAPHALSPTTYLPNRIITKKEFPGVDV